MELQQRLQKLWLYQGPADGDYTDRVEGGVHRFQSYMSIESDPEVCTDRPPVARWRSGRATTARTDEGPAVRPADVIGVPEHVLYRDGTK
ncbi:peptidoglycan-binding domain-containing protein [Streptomyces sp. M10(2022)]